MDSDDFSDDSTTSEEEEEYMDESNFNEKLIESVINEDYEGLIIQEKVREGEIRAFLSHPDWNNKYLAEKVEGGYRIIENTKKGMEEITWELLPPTFKSRRSSTFERRRWQDNKCRRCGFIGLHPRNSYTHPSRSNMRAVQATELNKPYDDIDWNKVLIWEEWDGLEGEDEESEDTARKQPKVQQVQFGQTYLVWKPKKKKSDHPQ